MYVNSVIPLYAYDGDTKKYHSIGSAVLVAHRSRRFFVTAAHVIEELQGKKTFIFFDNVFYEIDGLPVLLSDCSTFDNRNDDPLDLAVICIPDNLFQESANAKYITIDQYQIGIEIKSAFFQAIGFPQSKNSRAVNRTVRLKGEFLAEGLRYTVVDISDNAFPHKKLDVSTHIATTLTKSGAVQLSRQRKDTPDLHGISGGLLQKVCDYNQITDGFSCAYPAGIILEKKKDNSAFFSLRLSVVFAWLDIHWERHITMGSSEPAQTVARSS